MSHKWPQLKCAENADTLYVRIIYALSSIFPTRYTIDYSQNECGPHCGQTEVLNLCIQLVWLNAVLLQYNIYIWKKMRVRIFTIPRFRPSFARLNVFSEFSHNHKYINVV